MIRFRRKKILLCFMVQAPGWGTNSMATDAQSNAMHDVTMNQRKEEKPSLQLKAEVKFFSRGLIMIGADLKRPFM